MIDQMLCNGFPLSLIILAGGGSRRMGRDKALLPVGNETLIERLISQLNEYFAEIIISVSSDRNYTFLPYKRVQDIESGQGPMMGLYSALSHSKNEKNFVISCDIPDIGISFVERMVALADGCDIVVPLSHGGKYEPLFAVYSKSVRKEMAGLLDTGERSLLPLFNILSIRTLPIEGESWFKNLNTFQDYEDYLIGR
ncbi:molybdenum cofactor guanylyltransferase [Acidobacteriota bacterium]